MALGPESAAAALEQDTEHDELEAGDDAPSHNPSAPPDELFDISTTVDPSYIISSIRKLLPSNSASNCSSSGADGGSVEVRSSDNGKMEAKASSLDEDRVLESVYEHERMDIVDDLEKSGSRGEEDDDSGNEIEKKWEKYGCLLWDLAAINTHAEIMVENLILDVLLANLMVIQSVRVTEICLGIIGNLACHEVLMKNIVSTNRLIPTIIEKLFLDDTQCLCEAFRLLTSGIQSSECLIWTGELQSEHILSRILWIIENALNPHLIEKSVGLLLAILESPQEIVSMLLPPLMKLGLASLVVNLLAFEMDKLKNERMPERYPVLDVILRAIENLSTVEGYSQEICSNKELFQLVCDLLKLPDKDEVSDSCVTAAVLIANILSEASDLVSEILHDFPFLQSLLDILYFAADDLEARRALWSAIARVLVNVKEDQISASDLHHYMSVLVSKTDLIEDDLLDSQLEETNREHGKPAIDTKSDARSIALRRIISILNKWNASKNQLEKNDPAEEDEENSGNISRLLDCCCKYIESNVEQVFTDQ